MDVCGDRGERRLLVAMVDDVSDRGGDDCEIAGHTGTVRARMATVDPNPVRVSALERRLLRVLTVTAWLGCIALVCFVGLRLTGHDRAPSVAAVQSFTLYLLFPAWLALGFAIGARKRGLTAVSGFLVLTHVVLLYPEMHAGLDISREARDAPTIRVIDANLWQENVRVDEIIDEVRSSGADIVLLQEYGKANRRAFQESGVLDAYPFQLEFEQDSPFGALIASKLPFLESSLADIGGIEMPHAVVDTAIGPVDVISVHANRPVTAAENRGWTAQHAELAHLVRTRTRPLVLGGDFNATTSHRPFRDLLHAGITDAHRALGQGLSNSWPNDRRYPPLIRIDHLLTTREIVPLHIRNGTGAGSDHVPFIADLALVG